MNFKIGNKIIGKKRVFVIAEIGVNHNGVLSHCKKLIKKAKDSGADAVKLQIINPDESYAKNTKSYKIFKKNHLTYDEIKKIKAYSKKLKIILFATPGDFSSLEIVKKLKFPAIKISSGLLTNHPLISEAASLKIPLILSSGFSNLLEIKQAVDVVKKYHNKFSILKCTSIYPAEISKLNLSGIFTLKKKFRNISIGFSDHSLGDLGCIVAVSIGAKIIEKHFTLNNKDKGADHKISLMPKEFKNMVQKIRQTEASLGNKYRFPTKEELKTKKYFQRTIVSRIEIKKGEKLSKKNISIKRVNSVGPRMEPKYFFRMIGKKVKKTIKPDSVINKKFIV